MVDKSNQLSTMIVPSESVEYHGEELEENGISQLPNYADHQSNNNVSENDIQVVSNKTSSVEFFLLKYLC